MRRRVIGHGGKARRPEHDCAHPLAGLEALAAEEQRLVVLEAESLLELGPGSGLLTLDEAGVADLPTALRIEGRLPQLGQEEPLAELLERAYLRQHLGLLVADELALEARLVRELGRAHVPAAGTGPRALALLLHPLGEALLVDRHAALVRQLAGQLEREAVGVVELEGVLARQLLALGQLLEQTH